MEKIFYPESLVVIGVSPRPENMGKFIVANLLEFGYRGKIYAVGRERGEVFGLPIYDSLEELPEGIDLAVFLVPAPLVPHLLEECGRRGIRRAVIESGGFSEFSAEGARLEEELLEVARRWGIRFVGPNCISIINLENGLSLPFVPLSRSAARPGKVSVVAQSGGVSLTYANLLSVPGLGVDKVVSIGNKTDLDEIDYLEYLIGDEGTELIVLYLSGGDRGGAAADGAGQGFREAHLIAQGPSRGGERGDRPVAHRGAGQRRSRGERRLRTVRNRPCPRLPHRGELRQGPPPPSG